MNISNEKNWIKNDHKKFKLESKSNNLYNKEIHESEIKIMLKTINML